MSPYKGDLLPGATLKFLWNSSGANGASITRATNGTISVYKDGGTTQTTTGVTDTEDFDSLTGVHLVAIDTSSDETFYSPHSDFSVVLSAATIDGQTVNAVIAEFSIMNRGSLKFATYAKVSNAVASPTLTNFRAANISEATADHFIGRSCYPYTGNLIKQAIGVVTDYALTSSEGNFTISPGSPAGESLANGDRVLVM
jgi:hypothetical protein